VRASRGPRRTPRTPEREREQIESRETEQWIDEGSVRDAAEAATRRASGSRPRRSTDVDPEVVAEIHDAVDPRRAARLSERLAAASSALDRERFDEARRLVAPLVRELPQVAAVHEVSGLAAYRTGRWRQAAQSLELARQLRRDPSLLPVLADCYRAMKRWPEVDEVWREVKAASPPHDVMAEARIVAAGALADRGELKQAIELLESGQKRPKRVRDHHLRQWYVLADLYDRAGDTMAASRWFREIAAHDPAFADVRDRLRGLGR
jgi:tetratricopeptide (TPR) repeat protein